MQRNLVPFNVPRYFMGDFLPFDLFNNHGVLVLQRGSKLDDPARFARLSKMSLYCSKWDSGGEHCVPEDDLDELGRRYAVATAEGGQLVPADLAQIAEDLHRLVREYPALCLGMARHLPLESRARGQALFVAALAGHLAANLGLDIPTQLTLMRAALAMNLSSFALQDTLENEARLPTHEECEQLWDHPRQSADLLYEAGVRDSDWLNVVRQHHENLDRSGYPYRVGFDAMTVEARILRVTDVFAALIGQRRTRTGYAPRQAMRLAFERERGRLDDSVMLTLRRVMGKYPPGTLVKLANRQTALVTRWFRNTDSPKFVVTVLRPSGTPISNPHVRETRRRGYSICGYASLPDDPPPLDWRAIWAQG